MMWQTHEARHISIVKNKPNELHLYSNRALQGRGYGGDVKNKPHSPNIK